MQCSKVLSLAAVALLVGCQTSDLPTGAGEISAVIADGAHTGDLSNSHFFFLPPIVPEPKSYDPTLFNSTYRPVVRICEFDAVAAQGTGDPIPPTGNGLDECGEGTNRIFPDPDDFPPFSAPLSPTVDHYIYHWQTVGDNLGTFAEDKKIYRVYVFQDDPETAWPDKVLFGFADVQVEATQANLKKVNTRKFVPLFIDRTLPVKFAIEEGAWCEAFGDLSTCVEGTVDTDAEDGSEVADPLGTGIFIPKQSTSQTLTLALLPCTDGANAKPDLEIDLVKVGPCFELAPSSNIELDVSPTISSCVTEDDLGDLTSAQLELLKLHRRSDAGVITALPTAKDNCVNPLFSRSLHPNPVVRFAQNTWRKALDGLAAVTIGRPLYANSSMFIDRFERGGNPDADDECCSQFQFALPSTIEKFSGDNLTAPTGPPGLLSPNTPAVIVRDVDGDPVQGATVNFGVPTFDGALIAPTVVTTDAAGIAHLGGWVLDLGVNELDASGRGFGLPTSLGGDGPFIPDDDAGTASDPLLITPATVKFVTFTATGVVQLFFPDDGGLPDTKNLTVDEAFHVVVCGADPDEALTVTLGAFNNNGTPQKLELAIVYEGDPAEEDPDGTVFGDTRVPGDEPPAQVADPGCIDFHVAETKSGGIRFVASAESAVSVTSPRFNVRPPKK